MNKSESKYFNTARKMDEALMVLLEKKAFDYITIKEICAEAGVNRSTFYLHYDNTRDLLEETLEYLNEKFNSYFQSNDIETAQKIESGSLDELMFITRENLEPYLSFIRDNKKIFKAVLDAPEIYASQSSYERLAELLFFPIMKRFNIPQKEQKYMLLFYIKGIMGIIEEWLRNDCEDSIEFVSGLIIKVILNCEK